MDLWTNTSRMPSGLGSFHRRKNVRRAATGAALLGGGAAAYHFGPRAFKAFKGTKIGGKLFRRGRKAYKAFGASKRGAGVIRGFKQASGGGSKLWKGIKTAVKAATKF